MLTEWRPIVSFPGYSVSDTGRVRNDDTDRIMTLMRNQTGIVHVGLTKDRHQYKRAVCRLVADAFLVPPRHETFDTPVNLDGDRLNNHVENLLWRPRHFATRYFAQFKLGPIQPSYSVQERNTGQQFETTWEAALTYGLIETDVRVASRLGSEVWPTYQMFRRL